MSSRGSITLGELEGKLTMLEVNCHRCERRGRVSLARLIEEHRADMGCPICGRASRAIARTRTQRRCIVAAPSTIRNCRRCSCPASKPNPPQCKLLSVKEALNAYEADLRTRGGDTSNVTRVRGHLPQALLGKVVALLTSRGAAPVARRLTNSLAPAS